MDSHNPNKLFTVFSEYFAPVLVHFGLSMSTGVSRTNLCVYGAFALGGRGPSKSFEPTYGSMGAVLSLDEVPRSVEGKRTWWRTQSRSMFCFPFARACCPSPQFRSY